MSSDQFAEKEGQDVDKFAEMAIDAALSELDSTPDGLTSDEAKNRLASHGANALSEEHTPLWRRLLSYFWGPIPWMIEIAAVLSAVNQDWKSFIVIIVMLLINGAIGFWQEKSAADALDALKGQLALKARAKRDGRWVEVEATTLVPGDVVRVRLGDVTPADIKLFDGDYLSIDQSALTGESLPVTKKSGEVAYSSSLIKEGEMVAAVCATGADTFIGRTAKLVQGAGAVSHFQEAVLHLGNLLIVSAVVLSAILVGVEIARGLPLLELISFVLIVVVASIPVALPAVLSVTMALGALALSRMKAIVSRLEAIEEMAGVDILCTDKTGTLTQNKLTLGDPVRFEAKDNADILLCAALASKEENRDAIDNAVIEALPDRTVLDNYRQTRFTPFDPTHKRTEAGIEADDGPAFAVTKGAPQVIIQMCKLAGETLEQARNAVDEAAKTGFRTLGVARSSDDGENWHFLGILPMYDPPREDSAQTILDARAHGISVKMVTGDNTAIGREIARELDMGTNILPSSKLREAEATDTDTGGTQAAQLIEQADGFAEVFPEHKYAIVKSLQAGGHIVAMTGDGVNDAPALKQAEVGIAVSGATDAARSAASLILTAPGLSVITSAVEEARRIFERMMSYTIYRIAMTLNIMIFVVWAMLVYNEYPLTTIMIILLALLDDIPIMTIAWDNAELSTTPVKWQMGRLLTISSVMGAMALAEIIGLYLLARDVFHVDLAQTQTMMFLGLIVGGHLLLFLTRTRHAFWQPPYPAWQLASAIVATQAIAVLFVGLGWLMTPIPWLAIGLIWLYDLAWMVVIDLVKLGAYRLMEHSADHHHRFLEEFQHPIHPAHSHRG